MWKLTFILTSILAAAALCSGQARRAERSENPTPSKKATIPNPFAGKWTYRSYHNRTGIVDQDAALALSLIFGEGVITVENTDLKTFKGSFDMGGGYVLDMEGSVRWQTYVSPTIFEISGKGRAGTPTEGWQYDYVGYLTWEWPNGIGQVPAIVGTVIRTKPHGTAQAGYVALFITTKHP
jgi:hypothetical protein